MSLNNVSTEQLKTIKDNDWGSNSVLSVKVQQLIWWLEHPFIKNISVDIDWQSNDQGGSDPYLSCEYIQITAGLEKDFLDYIITLNNTLTAGLMHVILTPLTNPTQEQLEQSDYINDLIKRFNALYERTDINFYTLSLKATHIDIHELLLDLIKYLTKYKNGYFAVSGHFVDSCGFEFDSDYAEDIQEILNEQLNVFENEYVFFTSAPTDKETYEILSSIYSKASNIVKSLDKYINVNVK